jgi:hypothetical protein
MSVDIEGRLGSEQTEAARHRQRVIDPNLDLRSEWVIVTGPQLTRGAGRQRSLPSNSPLAHPEEDNARLGPLTVEDLVTIRIKGLGREPGEIQLHECLLAMGLAVWVSGEPQHHYCDFEIGDAIQLGRGA